MWLAKKEFLFSSGSVTSGDPPTQIHPFPVVGHPGQNPSAIDLQT